MALRFSESVRDYMLGYKARCNVLYISSEKIALNDNGASLDTIVKSAGDSFVTSGFEPGDMITISGADTAANDGSYVILSVTATIISIPSGSLTGSDAEDAQASLILGSARGGSLIDQFRNATMKIYTGSQPASADDAESGSELVQITISSGTFTADSDTNGINFGQILAATLGMGYGVADGTTEEVWSGSASATGTAGWFRIYDNAAAGGADDRCIDGAIATSGSQMNMANTTITSGGTTTIDSVSIPMAESV